MNDKYKRLGWLFVTVSCLISLFAIGLRSVDIITVWACVIGVIGMVTAEKSGILKEREDER